MDSDAEDVARAVLAKASGNDQRFATPDPTIVAAWTEHMERLTLADALAAVTEHYDRETRRIMPADVRRIATRLANERHDRNKIREITQAPSRRGQLRAVSMARDAFQDATGIKTAPQPNDLPWQPRRSRRRKPVVSGPTDAELAARGTPLTVCFRCVKEIPAPKGWDPANPESQRLYCGACAEIVRGESPKADS